MEGKKSFVLYTDYAKYFARLSLKEQGKLISAIFAYQTRGVEADDLSPAADMAFCFIKDQMDRDQEKYENVSRSNSENGKKGGRPSKSKTSKQENQFEESEKSDRFFEKATESLNDTDTDTENETETETENDHLSLPPSAGAAQPSSVGTALKERFSEKTAKEEFERLWEQYPRKEGKKDAMNAYIRARKKGVTYETVESGIKAYAESCRNRDPQYIKYGSSWFNGEGWNDDYVKEARYHEGAETRAFLDELFADSIL